MEEVEDHREMVQTPTWTSRLYQVAIKSRYIMTLLAALPVVVSFLAYFAVLVMHNAILSLCGRLELIVFSVLLLVTLLCVGVCSFFIYKLFRPSASVNYAALDDSKHGQLVDRRRRMHCCALGLFLIFSFISASVLSVLSVIAIGITTRTLPVESGTVLLNGHSLSAPVHIEREANGMIHIVGQTKDDVTFAQGFATAQERLWQIELNRRVASGTLSEIVGEQGVEIDRFARIMGFKDRVERDLANNAFSINITRMAQRYVDGINAFIERTPLSKLQPELSVVFRYKPKPFTLTDMLLTGKLMSYQLSTNAAHEWERFHLMRNNVSRDRAEEFVPEFPIDRLTVLTKEELGLNSTDIEDEFIENQFADSSAAFIPDAENIILDRKIDKLFSKLLGTTHNTPFASNNWVVSGKLMENGKAFCASDPHLDIIAPGVWIMFHLKTLADPSENNWSAYGASMPGVPGIVIGRNEHVCWGMTNSMPDVQDFYVIDDRGDKYFHNGELKQYETKTEIIKVKGSASVQVKVRNTVYGPVVNDIFADYLGQQHTMALKWNSLDANDTSAETFLGLINVRDWREFKENMRTFVAPTQNFVFGDKFGNIGYIAPGRIPVRKLGHSGKFPVPGNGQWDWQGYIPFDELPSTFNPAKGFIVSANNRPHPKGYPYNYSRDFYTGYRATRITELILQLKDSGKKMTVEDMKKIQLDTKSLLYIDTATVFTAMAGKFDSASDAKYELWRDKLTKWDGEEQNSKEATVFESFFLQMMFYPELEIGRSHMDEYFIANTWKKAENVDRLASIFKRAVDKVTKNGDIPAWGTEYHYLSIEHLVLGETPLKCLTNRGFFNRGGSSTVSIGFDEPVGYDDFSLVSHFGPSYRQLVNFDEFDQWIIPMGQSGNWFSVHYDDMTTMFRDGKYHSMKFNNYRVTKKLTLENQG